MPSANSRNSSYCPRSPSVSSDGFVASARLEPSAPSWPATFENPVAKRLCQNSAIFSWRGRVVCTIRKS